MRAQPAELLAAPPKRASMYLSETLPLGQRMSEQIFLFGRSVYKRPVGGNSESFKAARLQSANVQCIDSCSERYSIISC